MTEQGERKPAMVRLELMAGEEADAVAEAVALKTPNATVEALPGLLSISAPGRLELDCSAVSEALGRPWDTRQLQVILSNYVGFIARMDEAGVAVEWRDREDGGGKG